MNNFNSFVKTSTNTINLNVDDIEIENQLQVTNQLDINQAGDIITFGSITANSITSNNYNVSNLTTFNLNVSGSSNLRGAVTLNSSLNVSGLSSFNNNVNLNNAKLLNVSNIDNTNANLNLSTIGDNDINLTRFTGVSLILKNNFINNNGDVITSGNNTFNSAIFVSGVSTLRDVVSNNQTANSLFCGNVDAGTLNLGNTSTAVNIACSNNIQTVNIGSNGTAGATTINIGHSGDQVNVGGTLATVNTTNLSILDNNILLNSGSSGSGTARGAGLSIRDNNNNNQAYIQVSNLGTSYDIKAPENNFILNTGILTQNETVATTNNISGLSSIYFKQSGGVITGATTINSTLALGIAGQYDKYTNASNGGTADYRIIDVSTNNKGQWAIGSLFNDFDFALHNYSNTGSYINSPIMVQKTTGNMGIGTTNPLSTLTLSENYSNAGNVPEQTSNQILLQSNSISSFGAGVRLRVPSNSTVNDSDLQFTTTDNFGVQIPRMTIKGSSNPYGGRVGINTDNPNALLDVNGTTILNGASTVNSSLNTSNDLTIGDAIGQKILNINAGASANSLLRFNTAKGAQSWTHWVLPNSNYDFIYRDGSGVDYTFYRYNVSGGTWLNQNTLFMPVNNFSVGDYNENVRIPEASNGFSTLLMGCPVNSISGTGANIYSFLRTDAGSNRTFQLRHNTGAIQVWNATGNTCIGSSINPTQKLVVEGDTNLDGNFNYSISGVKLNRNVSFGFDGSTTPTLSRIRPSGVSAGITRNGTGDYTINISGPSNFLASSAGVPIIHINTSDHKLTATIAPAGGNSLDILTFDNGLANDLVGTTMWISYNYE